MRESTRTVLDALPAITPFLVLGLGFLALFLGYDWFWLVFVVGFAVVLPLVAIFTDTLVEWVESREAEREEEVDERADALDTLRDRYARGEIDEAEFERRLERLLETETVAQAEERRERAYEEARE